MPDKKVNLTLAYDGTGDGSTGKPYKGPAGLQKALSACSAGDVLLIYGTAFNSKLRTIAYDNLAGGTFSANQTIVNLTNTGTAIIFSDNGSNSMIVEVLTGTFQDNDTFNAGNGVSADVNGIPVMNGVDITVTGTANAPVTLIGCDNNFNPSENTPFVIDGETVSNTFNIAGTIQYLNFINMKITRTKSGTNYGMHIKSGSGTRFFFKNVAFVAIPYISIGNITNSFFYQCSFRSGGQTSMTSQGSHFRNCEFVGNATYGIQAVSNTFENCVFAKNNYGIYASGSLQNSFLNCVFDGNTTRGMLFAGASSAIVDKCEFTNNTGAAIEIPSGTVLYEGTNNYYNNGNNNTIISAGGLIQFGQRSAADPLYVDRDANHYNKLLISPNKNIRTRIGAV